jgi:hypothetical protein
LNPGTGMDSPFKFLVLHDFVFLTETASIDLQS